MQPRVALGQVLCPLRVLGARCKMNDKYPRSVPFWILGFAVESNLNKVRSFC